MTELELALAYCLDDRAEIWFIAYDMNCDGVFTISDVGLWLRWAFFLPGDGLLWLLFKIWPGLATFLELTISDYGGVFSVAFSIAAWLSVLGSILQMLIELRQWLKWHSDD